MALNSLQKDFLSKEINYLLGKKATPAQISNELMKYGFKTSTIRSYIKRLKKR